MLPISKNYAVQLLEESARALSGGSSYQQALAAEITEAIRYSVFARIAREQRGCAEKQPKPPKAQRGQYQKPPGYYKRIERIAALCAEGKSLRQIGAALGITYERVRQIIAKTGIQRIKSKSTKTADRLAAARIGSDKRCMEKWGVSHEGMKALNAAGIIAAYRSQKSAARNRLIPWRLTFQEWHACWLDSGKLDFRGRGRGRYVMTFSDRSRGYEVGNVRITLYEQSIRETRARTRGNVAANTGVYCMYPGLSKPWVARVNRKSIGHFATAEQAIAARSQALAQTPERC